MKPRRFRQTPIICEPRRAVFAPAIMIMKFNGRVLDSFIMGNCPRAQGHVHSTNIHFFTPSVCGAPWFKTSASHVGRFHTKRSLLSNSLEFILILVSGMRKRRNIKYMIALVLY